MLYIGLILVLAGCGGGGTDGGSGGGSFISLPFQDKRWTEVGNNEHTYTFGISESGSNQSRSGIGSECFDLDFNNCISFTWTRPANNEIRIEKENGSVVIATITSAFGSGEFLEASVLSIDGVDFQLIVQI